MSNAQRLPERKGAEPEQLSPFGWYPDPAGSSDLRLWDGHRWTTRLVGRVPDAEPVYDYASDGTVRRRFSY